MHPRNNAAILVEGLTKYYGQRLVVDHITFEVGRGEFLGFLGPNGAGKTTTLRMLTGVTNADQGRASILGYRAGSLLAKQATGVVPEIANPYPNLSGWDNLMLIAELYGVPKLVARERATNLFDQVELSNRKDNPTRTYSKGMKQRLMLCQALISEPELLFLDEPTSGLDVQSARLIEDMLRQLTTQGKTIFLTTHNLEEANRLCDRVAIINHGRIIALDAPEKIRMATSHKHSVEVSFNDRVSLEALSKLRGVEEVKRMGGKYRLYTSDSGDVVVSLVNYACSSGYKIISLSTLGPSLEDAFLALTERK